MILTTLPDLPPRPATPANAEFRRRFYERWGRENAIVCGEATHAEYDVWPQALSIKTVSGGSERYALARRQLAVDDDNWLVLNEGSRYGSVLHAPRTAPRPAFSFCVFFRPGLAAEVAAWQQRTLGAALDDPGPAPAPAFAGFAEHLRPHGGAVSARLAALAAAVRDGERDEQWLEEELTLLAGLLLEVERCDASRAAARGARSAQRAELRRRLQLALDFLESHYAEPLTLERMAEAACLSRYHFVREFARAYGLTPHAWLMRKRARAARRWLDAGTPRAQVAALVGFGSRWAMQRALERHAPSPAAAPEAAARDAARTFAQSAHAAASPCRSRLGA
jgi:AraC-like DNA-binding protein